MASDPSSLRRACEPDYGAGPWFACPRRRAVCHARRGASCDALPVSLGPRAALAKAQFGYSRGMAKARADLHLRQLRWAAAEVAGPVSRLRRMEHADRVGGAAEALRARAVRGSGRAHAARSRRRQHRRSADDGARRVRSRARRRSRAGRRRLDRRRSRHRQVDAVAASARESRAASSDVLRHGRGIARADRLTRAAPRRRRRAARHARRDLRRSRARERRRAATSSACSRSIRSKRCSARSCSRRPAP